jgi:hypothetical protein
MLSVRADLRGDLYVRSGGHWTPIPGHGSDKPSSKLYAVHLASDGTHLAIHVEGKFVILGSETETESIGKIHVDLEASPIVFYSRDEQGKLSVYTFPG